MSTAVAAAALVAPALVVVGMSSQPAGAGVISEGDVVIGPAPPAVGDNVGESNHRITFFQERSDSTLSSNLHVDITPPASYPATYNGLVNLTPGHIAAGTAVDSYFMVSNPVGTPNFLRFYTGVVTFDTPILGVIVQTSTLNTSTGAVGAPDTTYTFDADAGFENDGDAVQLLKPNEIAVNLFTSTDIDALRIITAASPNTSPGGYGGGGTAVAPGYTEIASDGGIFNFGTTFYGSMGGIPLNAPMVGGANVPGRLGYWEVASDGGIFSFGPDAQFYGSMGGTPLNKPVVGMAPTWDGQGYWEVASDGGIFSFGDAHFYGSTGGKKLNKPIVGMAATPDGQGYWLVASDGGIFSYGDAHFYGSTGAITLNKPIVAMTATPSGAGYWLVASDGGVFSFGDASFYGSMGGIPLNKPMVGMKTTADGSGYWTFASDGGVFSYGDAVFLGSMGGTPLNQPVVGAF